MSASGVTTSTASAAGTGLVQLLLIRREALLGECRQIEDMLLEQGLISERRVVSGRMMRRLYEAFGEEAVRAALADT